MNKYTVIDIETTGLKYEEGAEITEIAGINVVDGEVLTSFSSTIKITGIITEFIRNLTGITNDMCKNSRDFEEVFVLFMDCLNISNDTNLVIFNVEFDFNFIKFYLERNTFIPNMCKEMFLNCNKICALELARKVLPGWPSHKLDYLKERFGIKTKSHRALNDVLVTNKVYQELLRLEREQCQ